MQRGTRSNQDNDCIGSRCHEETAYHYEEEGIQNKRRSDQRNYYEIPMMGYETGKLEQNE